MIEGNKRNRFDPILPTILEFDKRIQEIREKSIRNNDDELFDFLTEARQELEGLHLFILSELLSQHELNGNLKECENVVADLKKFFDKDPLSFIISANFLRSKKNDLQGAKQEIIHAIKLSEETGDFYIQSNIEMISILEEEGDLPGIERILRNILRHRSPPGCLDERVSESFLKKLELIGVDLKLIKKLTKGL